MEYKVISNQRVSPTSWEISVACPEIASEARPGQFVMVRVGNDMDTFLRRPLSIHDVKDPSTLTLLYKVIGKGTELMTCLKKGDNLDLLGPLGTGFKFSANLESAIIISGGIGIAPMIFLLRCLREDSLKSKNLKKENVYFLYGAKNRDEILCLNLVRSLGAQVLITTEDGSLGKKGIINGQLEKLLKMIMSDKINKVVKKKISIFASGPNNMLKEVSSVASRFEIPCQISLEAKMACGFGACLGCAVKVKKENGRVKYKMVCHDGPVFDAGEIVWESLL